ncbi:hypothetical protein lbkm_4244 [Lachnospiraceae bacterium KM106-2]|nr:hypothetical protein lbkm_4244 [Lachnospiraceae bacterium KM106-2]
MKMSEEERLQYQFDQQLLSYHADYKAIGIAIHIVYAMILAFTAVIPAYAIVAMVLFAQLILTSLKFATLFSSSTTGKVNPIMGKNLYFPVTRQVIKKSKLRLILKYLLQEFAIALICLFQMVIEFGSINLIKILLVYGCIVVGAGITFLRVYLMHRSELNQ